MIENLHILICILFVVVPAFLLTKKLKSRTTKVLCVVLPVIILTPIVYFITTFMVSSFATSVTHKKFDKDKWKKDKSNRFVYSFYVDTSSLITKKTSDEVIKILGEPDSKSDTLFVYGLSDGNWRSQYGLNPWMNIEFKSDTVSNHYTIWD